MIDIPVWLCVVLAALATWRITHLLTGEDGPGDVIARVRARLGDGFLGRLMDCFYCLSLWVAAPLALLVSTSPLGWALSWLALSGAACLLELMTQTPVVMQPPSPTITTAAAKGGSGDGMLRTNENGDYRQFDASQIEG
jgi:hypothetical protein